MRLWMLTAACRTPGVLATLFVVITTATCGRNETPTPISPSATGSFSFVSVDAASTATLVSISIHPSIVKGGESTQATVTLSGPAPTGGFAIALASDDTAATVPAAITVAEGAASGTFSIATRVVPADVQIRISATEGGTTLAVLIRVTQPNPLLLTVDPVRPTGGAIATGTITLSSPAPAGGTVVRLRSEGGDALVPTTITIAGGSRRGTFTIATRDVSKDADIWIHATADRDSSSVQIRRSRSWWTIPSGLNARWRLRNQAHRRAVQELHDHAGQPEHQPSVALTIA